MPASMKWVSEHKGEVLRLYRDQKNYSTPQIAKMLNTRSANITESLRRHMPEAEYAALKSLKYSASKLGSKNPMFGKHGTAHHNWKGACEDGRGYLTILWGGKRRFLHQVVMMKALGVKALPDGMAVHHIDEDPKNNALDNLALVTRAGHQRIHFLQVKDSQALSARKFKLAEALKYMT